MNALTGFFLSFWRKRRLEWQKNGRKEMAKQLLKIKRDQNYLKLIYVYFNECIYEANLQGDFFYWFRPNIFSKYLHDLHFLIGNIYQIISQ